MDLSEKLRQLRKDESMRRGLWRTLTQHEVIRAMRQEIGVSLSQAYLSQLESGARSNLTSVTREALARFYRVSPGYLVDDPPGETLRPDATPVVGGSLAEALARVVAAPEPERVARLIEGLLRLPPEELEALERRLFGAGPSASGDMGEA